MLKQAALIIGVIVLVGPARNDLPRPSENQTEILFHPTHVYRHSRTWSATRAAAPEHRL